VLQQVWHLKEPSLLKAISAQRTCLNMLPVMVTATIDSPCGYKQTCEIVLFACLLILVRVCLSVYVAISFFFKCLVRPKDY
jgi:hypothetical protein